jgi:hypothetical protein
LARGARNEDEARAAQQIVAHMRAVSDAAFEASWSIGLADRLRPIVEELHAGKKDVGIDLPNPDAVGVDEVARSLALIAALAKEHQIWIVETDAPRDFLRVVPKAF